MSEKFNKYMKVDRIKGILCFILILCLAGAVAVLGIKLSRQTTTNRLGVESYSVGQLKVVEKEDENGVKFNTVDFDSAVKTSMSTEDNITTDGLSIKLEEDSGITYKLFFFDKDGKFLSCTDELDSSLNPLHIPESAKSVKIMITPVVENGAEPSNISLLDKFGLSDKLVVVYNK